MSNVMREQVLAAIFAQHGEPEPDNLACELADYEDAPFLAVQHGARDRVWYTPGHSIEKLAGELAQCADPGDGWDDPIIYSLDRGHGYVMRRRYFCAAIDTNVQRAVLDNLRAVAA